MLRISDEWCCMNCANMDKCVEENPNINLLDYCTSYVDKDAEK